jgi:ADP-ribose pyrophosphatase YjhB (NUDIX family)
MDKNIILQVGVKVLLKNQEGKYLLLQRSAEKYPDVSGRWDIVGGRINPGQSLIENLQREIKEETNLELLGEPKLICAQDIFASEEKHVVRLTYIGQAKGDIKLDESENISFGWFSKTELLEMKDLDIYLKKLILDDLVNF